MFRLLLSAQFNIFCRPTDILGKPAPALPAV
jgi:hypothetical protein